MGIFRGLSNYYSSPETNQKDLAWPLSSLDLNACSATIGSLVLIEPPVLIEPSLLTYLLSELVMN